MGIHLILLIMLMKRNDFNKIRLDVILIFNKNYIFKNYTLKFLIPIRKYKIESINHMHKLYFMVN